MNKFGNKCLSKRNIKHEKNRRKESWKTKNLQVIRKKVFLHIQNADSDGDVVIEIIQNMHASLSDNLVISVFKVPEKDMYLKIPSHLCVNNKYNCNVMNILIKTDSCPTIKHLLHITLNPNASFSLKVVSPELLNFDGVNTTNE